MPLSFLSSLSSNLPRTIYGLRYAQLSLLTPLAIMTILIVTSALTSGVRRCVSLGGSAGAILLVTSMVTLLLGPVATNDPRSRSLCILADVCCATLFIAAFIFSFVRGAGAGEVVVQWPSQGVWVPFVALVLSEGLMCLWSAFAVFAAHREGTGPAAAGDQAGIELGP
ncbi:MAG: hypothetical protein Q9174_003492, partial [Haloplaca sp. 1 TL-2023]